MAERVRKAIDPVTDSSGGYVPPELGYGMRFKDYGTYGLRQFGGWIREEILQDLTGREGARAYREMLDNSAVIGAMMFAIQQMMRKVSWRIEPANDSSQAQQLAEFADSLRNDMSHTWDNFIVESLSMLAYGYSAHEIVYKRRLGPQKEIPGNPEDSIPSSNYSDGRIGWRRLPIRGQDVTLKWFFDANGQVRGLTQQPWVGVLVDIPIEKLLLFRPLMHKNSPEGRSVLRNAYRSYYFIKRLEEMEAILIERMSGFPVIYVPNRLLDQAAAPVPAGQPMSATQSAAKATLELYKNIVTGVRVNEQMGLVLPGDPYVDADGHKTTMRQYEFKLVTPEHSKADLGTDKIIQRHKVDMLMTLICDFLMMGHEVRGTNNLGTMRVDMFYSAIEGWLMSVADVFNRYALPRIWEMNNLPSNLLPKFVPDMPQRLDLDALGTFIKNIADAGMPLFPDDELETYIRDAAGFPLFEDMEGPTRDLQVDLSIAERVPGATKDDPTGKQPERDQAEQNAKDKAAADKAKNNNRGPTQMNKRMLSPDGLHTAVMGLVAREILNRRKVARVSNGTAP